MSNLSPKSKMGSPSQNQDASPVANTSTDNPFEREDFRVSRYVNSVFPTEESLEGLDPLIINIKQQIRHVDTNILKAVRQQSTSGNQARTDLQLAQETVQELGGKIKEIQRRAATSESLVQDICKDIRKLDAAKRHLTATITALRRLAMLINAVDQLQIAVERSEYAEAGHLLLAVRELAAHFVPYASVPKIAELRGRMTATESSLKTACLREFQLLGEDSLPPALLDRLRASSLAVDALGPGVRDELVDSICRKEMSVYTAIFGTFGETAKLDRTVNRYKWLLRRLETRRDVLSIFPPDWCLSQLVAVTFCSVTKAQLGEVLDGMGGELSHQVDSLLKAVEATNIFELEMARKFEKINNYNNGSGHSNSPSMEESDDGDKKEEEDDDGRRVRDQSSSSAAGAKTRLEKLSNKNKQEPRINAAASAISRAPFKGAISSVFTPYLGVYVAHVEKELMWALDRMISEESWTAMSTELSVLRSSNELVDALQAELRECSNRVSRGRTLLNLAVVFRRVFKAYARRLVGRLPKTATGSMPSSGGLTTTPATVMMRPILGATDWQVKFTDDDWTAVCMVVSTAQHCQEMIGQLATAVANRLDPPNLADGDGGGALDVTDDEEEFASVVTTALNVLLLGVETRLETALTAMTKIHWAGVESVGDQSEWAGLARTTLTEVGGHLLGEALPPTLFRFFADRLLRSFSARLRDNIYKCRKISDIGCQQMRLDLEGIKSAFVSMARSAAAAASSSSSSSGGSYVMDAGAYAADVAAQLGAAEAVLKVAGAPIEAAGDTFAEVMPRGSPAEFQRIMDLKVMKKAAAGGGGGGGGDQQHQATFEKFYRRIGGGGGGVTVIGGRPASSPEPISMGGGRGGGRGMAAPPPSSSSSPLRTEGSSGSGGFKNMMGAPTGRDVAARFKMNPNVQAAKATAAAASDSMREMGRATMKALSFIKRTESQQ